MNEMATALLERPPIIIEKKESQKCPYINSRVCNALREKFEGDNYMEQNCLGKCDRDYKSCIQFKINDMVEAGIGMKGLEDIVLPLINQTYGECK